MEAKELMIGDWVQTQRFRQGQSDVDVEEQVDVYMLERLFDGTDIASPIPLTEEILLANGFEKDGDYFIFPNDQNLAIDNDDWCGEDFPFHIVYLTNDEPIPFVSIQFIHELQHALRLCGLTDLADNFKIK